MTSGAAWPGERALNGGADPVPVAGDGALWLCGKHFVGPDPAAATARTGTTTVVCLCEREELTGRYPRYVEWLAANAGGRAAWHPVPDLCAPSGAAGRLLLADLGGRLRRGERLLVHCGAGHGRAGTVAAALLIAGGSSVAGARSVVAASRPRAGPQSPEQVAFLEALGTAGV